MDLPSSAPTASTLSSPEPIITTPPTSSPIPAMSSSPAKRRRRRRLFRPDHGSLYDLMWEHAGTSLFVRPICWTDLHVRLLDARFIEMPPCDTPVPPQSPRGTPVSPSRCHMKPSPAATSLSRELTAMLAPGTNKFYTNSIRTIMSTLYPGRMSRVKTQLDLHHYFGGMVYRDTCRVQVAWEATPSRTGSIASFESASTRPAESFGVPTGADGTGSGGSSQQGTYTQPILAYVGKASVAATRRNMYRVMPGPNRSYNGPVERLQKLRSKMFVPPNANHDPLLVGIVLALAQRRFYGEPMPTANKWFPSKPMSFGLGEPEFHDVTVHILSNDNEASEFIVYKGVVTAELLRKFHEPTKNPRVTAGKTLAEKMGEAADKGGIRIEYTRVPIWPILGLKERLGKALGKEIVGHFDEDNIETWEEEAEPNNDKLKRRRDREALAEVFNGSFEEEAPDASSEHRTHYPRSAQASVNVGAGTVRGRTFGSVETFAGIPYAKPPVGALRLRPPTRFNTSLVDFDATGSAPACPQFVLSSDSRNIILDALGSLLTLPIFQPVTGQEDCLTVTIQRPAGTSAGSRLPVLFWIFGGGFEFGSTVSYNGASFVRDSIDLKQPFIFVGVNYRLGGFGFLPGREVLKDGSSNLGLLDQRMALEWVADNIAAFGGDPDKVTIWGESAGAISVFDQMALYDGDNRYKGRPLFRGAIMNSGSVVPADPIDCPKGQSIYDDVVRAAGCTGSTNTLECLRSVSYETFLNAAASVPSILSYESLALAYVPRPDGVALRDSPDILARDGRYAAIPMIIGNQEDEGTLFALFQPGVATTSQLVDYLSEFYFHNASKDQLTTLVNAYDRRISSGSPFRTGILNEICPGFKRRAAILGDLVFTLARRSYLVVAKSKYPSVPVWSYLNSYNYGTPLVGTFHASDIIQVFLGVLPTFARQSTRTYYLNFLYNQDPNVGIGGYATWPEWSQDQQLLWFFSDRTQYLKDDFRTDSFNFICGNMASLHVRDNSTSLPRWAL
ncbi:carboxylesterase [Colletotrichum karsti]|uniref:Carboxylesterase n=1 Tax=Colletotrichum karsti TaxID=1095194 RepID=A0A9P6I3P6_9PEZI|nr:carboxylesterase [Colletotrichum karsti]KAF9874391.1 carboxylesterase [Colletotrichum karsti]